MFEKLEDLAKNNKKISDFHIRAGSPLAYRATGEIIKVQEVMVTAQDLKDLLSMNCNEEELDDAGLSVITNDTKIVGIKLETSYMSEDKEKLYRYTSKNFGSIDSKVTKNNWTGFFRLDLPGNFIVYERDTYDGQIYEKLLITIPTKIDDVYNEGLREYM